MKSAKHGGQRAKSGRKPLNHTQICVRLTPGAIRWIRDQAQVEQTTLSQVVESCITKARFR